MNGPTATASYQLIPGYIDPDNNSSPTPFLLPPSANPTSGSASWTYNSSFVVNIPYVYQTPPKPSQSPLPQNDDFSFAWDTSTPPVAQVTVQNNNVWKAPQTARQGLQSNFATFLAHLEPLEIADQTIVSGGTYFIAQQVAAALPKALNEMLFYSYSFNPGTNAGGPPSTTPYVDLQPGMRLRLEVSGLQYGGPNSQPFNGFVGAGRFSYDVVSWVDQQGKRCTGFDAFLGAIAGPSITFGSGAQDKVVAGIIDLHAQGQQRRHYRLFYPNTYIAANVAGNTALASNVALIGADTLTDMGTATSQYLTKGLCGQAQPGNLPIICLVFLGRVIAIPEIAITLSSTLTLQSGQPAVTYSQLLYVPIGTTVRHMLDRLTDWNPTLGVCPMTHSRTDNKYEYDPSSLPLVSLQRLRPDLQSYLPVLSPVQLAPTSWTAPTPAPPLFDLPLLKGDCLTLSLTPTPVSS